MFVLQNESTRLKDLYELEILDTESESIYDNIAEMASVICNTPVAILSFTDSGRQWVKAKKGSSIIEAPRELSFCAHVIEEEKPLIIPDTLQDERFCENPYVTMTPGIRFYAGIPIKSLNGYGLGALCVIDYSPRKLTDAQLSLLCSLGKQVSDTLEKRRHFIRKTREVTKVTKKLCHEINNPLSIIMLSNIALKRKMEKNPELAIDMKRVNQAIESANRIGNIVVGLKETCLWNTHIQ